MKNSLFQGFAIPRIGRVRKRERERRKFVFVLKNVLKLSHSKAEI